MQWRAPTVTDGKAAGQAGLAGQDGVDAEDLSGGEYVADDDRDAVYGYCALPHHARVPSTRARAEQIRRHPRGGIEHDAG